MSNSVPFEVIAAPFTAWIAPVGTAFPDLSDAPAGPWTRIGTNGDLNYDESEGVVVEHQQEMTKWRAVGDMGARKVFRTSEDQVVRFKLVDFTLEQYSHALNSNAVTDVPAGVGTAGYRKIGLSRGSQVRTVALMVRGSVSPYGEDWVTQYEIPVAAQWSNPSVALSKKGEPAGYVLEFHSLVDPNAASEDERFGRLLAQDADPNT